MLLVFGNFGDDNISDLSWLFRLGIFSIMGQSVHDRFGEHIRQHTYNFYYLLLIFPMLIGSGLFLYTLLRNSKHNLKL